MPLVQDEQLRLKIIASNPAQLQLEFALWNRRAVMLAIKSLFGIDMPIRTVGEYLWRWGLTPQRPVKRALERDPARLKAWLEDEYPNIVARAKTEDAEIYWGDETAIRQDSHWVPGCSMAGLTPKLRLPAGRHGSTSMISAIINQGLVRFSFFEGAIDAERFIAFLEDLIQDAQRKLFLIVGNMRVRRANRARESAAENTEKIELFYLPPYAPELNPDEHLNRDLKTTIRSGPSDKTCRRTSREGAHLHGAHRWDAGSGSAVVFQP